MSEADPAAEPASSLHRGLSVRIALALAVLIVVAVLAVYAFMRTDSSPADSRPGPVASSVDPTPRAVAGAVAGEAEKKPAAETVADARDAKEGATAAAEPSPAANASNAESAPGTSARPAEPTAASGATDAAKPEASSPGATAGSETRASEAKPADVAAAAAPATPAAGQSAPAATAATPMTASTSPAADKPVRGPRLQAGVFLQQANAQAFKAKMEAQGFPVYVESRVHIGPFRDRKEAEKAREKLREMGVPTVLIAQ